MKNYPNSGQTVLIPAYEGDFLVNTQEELFLYDPDTETSRSLFSWTECGIAGLYHVPPPHVGAWISRAAQKLRKDRLFLSGLL